MGRKRTEFDPNHPKCLHPDLGRRVNEIIAVTGKDDPHETATAGGLRVDQVYGLWRGFTSVSLKQKRALESYYGMSLDTPKNAEPVTVPGHVMLAHDLATGEVLVTVRVPLATLAQFLAAAGAHASLARDTR